MEQELAKEQAKKHDDHPMIKLDHIKLTLESITSSIQANEQNVKSKIFNQSRLLIQF